MTADAPKHAVNNDGNWAGREGGKGREQCTPYY